ncbi:hypothetical protein ACIQBJ_31595 [Kitasatospora sp. NPDC088391]|uniref:hypothetical protein n=1 Tax=Kitasatospora sp. NPDC088391 TaxID=3364074 RepID=UPI0038203258
MSRPRPARWRRPLAALAVPAGVLALTALAPVPGSAAMPPPAHDPDPGCTGPAGPAVPVTGGTVTWCPGAEGGRLAFTNTGHAPADLSLVVHDCEGGRAPAVDAAKCAATLRATHTATWQQVAPGQRAAADFPVARGSNAQVWWTADGPDRATDLRLLGTPWNS